MYLFSLKTDRAVIPPGHEAPPRVVERHARHFRRVAVGKMEDHFSSLQIPYANLKRRRKRNTY